MLTVCARVRFGQEKRRGAVLAEEEGEQFGREEVQLRGRQAGRVRDFHAAEEQKGRFRGQDVHGRRREEHRLRRVSVRHVQRDANHTVRKSHARAPQGPEPD